MEFADDAFSLQLAHDIERHKAVGVLAHELRVVTAMLKIVLSPLKIVAAADAGGFPQSGLLSLGSYPECPSVLARRR